MCTGQLFERVKIGLVPCELIGVTRWEDKMVSDSHTVQKLTRSFPAVSNISTSSNKKLFVSNTWIFMMQIKHNETRPSQTINSIFSTHKTQYARQAAIQQTCSSKIVAVLHPTYA